jgi:hypothetical protein
MWRLPGPDHEYFSLTQEELLQRFLPSLPQFNPAFQAGLGPQELAVPHQYAQPVPLVNHSAKYPIHPDAAEGAVFRQHEPGLPLGPGHQLRRGDRAARRPADEGASLRRSQTRLLRRAYLAVKAAA